MSYNVLIVDDSKVIRSMVRKAIGMAGIPVGEVYEAGNGAEALQALEKHWIDIVLSDLSMPEMGGLELVDRMAESELLSRVPLVVVSSEQSEALVAALKARGVRGYVRKPFRPEQLRDAVSGALKEGSGR
jgi:two-component system, chemotaxis family, chemotaxis protein CheY